MILSDKEIKGSNVPYTIFRNSHLEANAVIRELEAENYCLKMRLEDCKLEAEEVASYINETMNENNLIEAKLRELVEAARAKDKFDSMKEPGLPGSKERNDFLDSRYWAWKRYKIALRIAEGK